MIKKNIWLLGTGLMSSDYAKVLIDLDCEFVTIGRGVENCEIFEKQFNKSTISGGLDLYLKSRPKLPSAVIVSVGIESLAQTCHLLLEYGVKKILLEKPGVGYASEIDDLASKSLECKAEIYLAYNRRFYSSVLKANEIIKQDGGVTSFNFEFTEWSHVISKLKKHKAEHQNWFLGNSTHIIDTAFFLAGEPKSLSAFYKGSLKWHPSSSIFAGAGETVNGALFSYQANWESPGRWVIEVLTKKHRLIFKPIETLQIQEIGSVALNAVKINDELDIKYKPGLFLQTKSFLDNKNDSLISIIDQKRMIDNFYLKMSGYSK